ncbi:MAG: ATP-binding protein [Blautia sp.]|nr:ATP-binding protein [Lachnoclostridium sp.]MCM1211734.1 ATP-binding protein [Blautia sp.]
MLAEFEVRNYRGFRDKLQFSLESAKNYEFNQEAVHNGIIKDSVVIGYNAAGKTNLGRAVMDIIIHLSDKEGNRIGDSSKLFYSNLYNQDNIVSFSYKFKFDSSYIEYTYEKENALQVIRESVKINGKKVIVNDNDTCFVHLKGTESLNLDNWDNSISLVKYTYANTVLDRADKNCQVFLKFMKFVNRMLWFGSTDRMQSIGSNLYGGSVLEAICGLENGVKNLEDFLQEANLPFKLLEGEGSRGETIYCKVGEKEVPFGPLMSSGIKALTFLCLWYMQREDFSFIFIDEFDAFYHTDLSIAIIRKLMKEENIQVIFTSHNTDIISNELLRPDCYFILEDNTIQPFCNLTDKSLREAHNLQKMYKAGAFHEQ